MGERSKKKGKLKKGGKDSWEKEEYVSVGKRRVEDQGKKGKTKTDTRTKGSKGKGKKAGRD